MDDFNLMFFNLIYTSLPPIMFGVFDRCVSAEMLSAFPELYKRGPKNKVRALWAQERGHRIHQAHLKSIALFRVERV